MVDDRPTTDERLRSYIAAQRDRERLSTEILALNPDFSEVQAVRPEGGPDGGKDVVATYRGNLSARAGVGFKATANDTTKQRNETKKKFKDDLTKALLKDPSLAAFAFFTNVDLTPTMVTDLIQEGEDAGLQETVIYHRERLREVLDAPEGFYLRHRYLGLSMTDEEQLRFFEKYGEDLRELIRKGFQTIDDRLDDVDFTAASAKPFRSAEFCVRLKRARSLQALGTCCVMLVSMKPRGRQAVNAFNLLYVSEFQLAGNPLPPPGRRHSPPPQNPRLLQHVGHHLGWWKARGTPQIEVANGVDDRTRYEDTLWTTARIDEDLPLRTLSDFDQRHYSIWISKRLLGEVKDFTFWVNEYRLFRFPLSAFDTEPISNEDLELFLAWHPALTRALIEQPWVTLHLKYDPSHHYFYSEAAPGNLTTDFATYTPVKDLDRPYGD